MVLCLGIPSGLGMILLAGAHLGMRNGMALNKPSKWWFLPIADTSATPGFIPSFPDRQQVHASLTTRQSQAGAVAGAPEPREARDRHDDSGSNV